MPRLYQTPSYELWWEPNDGTFCLQSPGRIFQGIPVVELVTRKNLRTVSGSDLVSGRVSQETLHDEHGLGQIVNIHYLETAGIALTLRIRLYQNRPFVLLRISITNVGSENVRIRHFSLRSTPGGVRSTAPPHGFFSNGWQSLSPAAYHNKDVFAVEPGWPFQRGRYLLMDSYKNMKHVSRKGLHISEMVGAVITPKEALVGGAITTADQFVQFYADLHSDNMQVELLSQADDVILDVGASSSSEWFYLEWVPLPNVDPFAQYVHAIIRQMNLGSMRTIPPGLRLSEIDGQQYSESVLFDRMASAVLFSDVLPINNIEVPDVCYSNRDKKGEHAGMRFSHTCNWIAQRIVGSGFMAKVTMSPLLRDPHSALVQAHPDWLLRTYRNTPVTARLPDRTALCLDITIPEVLEYLKTEIDTVVNQWGFSGINLDNMVAAVLPGHRYNQRMTRAQSLRQVYISIRNTAGQDVYITASQSPFGPAVGLVDAMQTSSASTTAWRPHRRKFHPKWSESPTLPTVRRTLLNTINRAWMNKHLWVNDPGPLMLKEKTAVLSRQELMNQITVFGLCGVALSFAEDLAEFTPEYRSLLSLLFPPLLDGLDVVNLFESPEPELIVVKMARSWGRWQLAGLINWGDTYVERALPTYLDLDIKNAYHLVNFWEKRYYQIRQDNAWPVIHLDPRSVVLLSLRPVIEHQPHIVGSTFHISQGGEISALNFDKSFLTLELHLGRTALGAVWLALPGKPVEVVVDNIRLDSSAVHTIAAGIYAITFTVQDKANLHVSWV